MTGRARVESGAPRRVSAATRRFVSESEATAAALTNAMATIVADARVELSQRERQLSEARRRLAQSKAALAACRAQPRANCSGQAQRVEADAAAVRGYESRVRIAQDVVSDVCKQMERVESASRRFLSAQRHLAESAQRALATAAADLDAYLAGAPHASFVQSALTTAAVVAEVAVSATGTAQLVHNVTQGHVIDTGDDETITQIEQQDVSDQQQLWKEAQMNEYEKESERLGLKPPTDT